MSSMNSMSMSSTGGKSMGPPSAQSSEGSMPPGEEKDPTEEFKKQIVEYSPQRRYVRFNEVLGKGAYKTVYRAYDTKEGLLVAWNTISLSGLPKHEKVRIMHEVRLLEQLDHGNIISFFGSWVNRDKEEVVFITEILSSGSLKDFIRKVQVIRWKIIKRWCRQILRGLNYLHSHTPPIIHRDLKCDNIFINGSSGDLRIGDLGLSTYITGKTAPLSVLGTPEFMAPELYDEKYDEKVDVYAFGMCVLEMTSKETPYQECANAAQIYKRVTSGLPPSVIMRVRSEKARDFILACLLHDPSRRPSVGDLLNHPFLRGADEDDDEVIIDPPPLKGDGSCGDLEPSKPRTNGMGSLSQHAHGHGHGHGGEAGGEVAHVHHVDAASPSMHVHMQAKPTQSSTRVAPQQPPAHGGGEVERKPGQSHGGGHHNKPPGAILERAETIKAGMRGLGGSQHPPSGYSSAASSEADPADLRHDHTVFGSSEGLPYVPEHARAPSSQSLTDGSQGHSSDTLVLNGGLPLSRSGSFETGSSGANMSPMPPDMMHHGMHVEHQEARPVTRAMSLYAPQSVNMGGDAHRPHGSMVMSRGEAGGEGWEGAQRRPSKDQLHLQMQQPGGAHKPSAPPTPLAPTVQVRQGEAGANVLCLEIRAKIKGKLRDIEFDFHLDQDDSVQVAQEMVTELGLPQSDLDPIARTVHHLAAQARMQRQQQAMGLVAPRPTAYAEGSRPASVSVDGVMPPPRPSSAGPAHRPSATMDMTHPILQHHQQNAHLHPPYRTRAESDTSVHHDMARHPSVTSMSGHAAAHGEHTDDELSRTSPPVSVVDEEEAKFATLLSDDEEEGHSDDEYLKLRLDYEKNVQRSQKAFSIRLENLKKSRMEKDEIHRKQVEKHLKDMADFEKKMRTAEREQQARLKELEENWRASRAEHREKRRQKQQPTSNNPQQPPHRSNSDAPLIAAGVGPGMRTLRTQSVPNLGGQGAEEPSEALATSGSLGGGMSDLSGSAAEKAVLHVAPPAASHGLEGPHA